MPALCHERLPFNLPPRLAMDAALPESDLIKALLKFATRLNATDKAALENLIDDMTDTTAAVAKDNDTFAPDPEIVEDAVELLRTKGVDDATIDELRKFCGVARPTQAQDSARRERTNRTVAKSYAEAFPEAARIGHDPY